MQNADERLREQLAAANERIATLEASWADMGAKLLEAEEREKRLCAVIELVAKLVEMAKQALTQTEEGSYVSNER